MQFVYNDEAYAAQRARIKKMSLEDNVMAIAALNKLARKVELTHDEAESVQRFIWHYENMQHELTCLTSSQKLKGQTEY